MSGRPCCRRAGRASPRRLGLAVAGGVVPGAALAALPKCPACLAAYLAVGTGLAVPVSGVAVARGGLLLLCLASVGCLAAIGARGLIRRHGRP